jgi:pyruvate/2-oxoglutarate dehydrogenase complex dihydrolipoamide acyltransferase (E2) component
MTEGNIATWRVKEGEKFAAGDVLLEIETDKATMDVEAQEDGILMKIMQGDGTKQVPVGSRIAVIAEEGDDISTLEIPPDESSQKPEAGKEAAKTESTRSPNPETQPDSPVPEPAKESTKAKAKAAKQTRPLLPSVAHLLHENGLDESVVAEMTPTGPNNRLLKGDVLAYLGKVKPDVPAAISARFDHQSHLDLTNIKVSIAEPKESKIPEKTEKSQAPVQEDAVIALPVSLDAVIDVQQKVRQTLGTFLPLSTFIARATELANDELPLPAGAKPSTDDLFNQILGLNKVKTSSRGRYLPQVSAIPPASLLAPRPAPRQADIIDILTAPAKKAAAPKPRSQLAPGTASGVNVFSLTVPKPEEKRARVFLERVKLVLENDPGRLVL